MKREACYRYTFEDGAEVITANMTCDLARELMAMHGKIADKRFVAWADEMTVGDLIDMDSFFGGDQNVSTVC